MRKAILPVLVLASVFLWVACDTGQPTAPFDLEPSFIIDDGSVNDALHGFYFLPPMVSQPSFDGTFMGNLLVNVDVFPVKKVLDDFGDLNDPNDDLFHLEWIMDCPVASFGSPEGVEVDTNGQHYQVNWQTDQIDLSCLTEMPELPPPDEELLPDVYRVAVHLNTKLLGYADVELVGNGAGFKNLTEGVEDIIGLIDGRTLPIKFRIENEHFDAVFHSNQEGSFDTFLLNSRTGVTVNITPHPALDATPNWSPDGSKIVFASNRANMGGPTMWGGSPDIYTMNPDGTGVELLAENGWKPEYSPNGTKIAFQRGWPPTSPDCGDPGDPPSQEWLDCEYGPEGREHDIWIMDADGGNQIQLTDANYDPSFSWDPYEDHDPTWHPTENWVTFARSHNAQAHDDECPRVLNDYCYFDLVSIDVTNPANLTWHRHTNVPQSDFLAPRWAPTGDYLAYQFSAEQGRLQAAGPFTPPGQLWGPYFNLADHPNFDDQNPSWAPGPEGGYKVMFTGACAPGDDQWYGICLAEDWDAWVAAGGTSGNDYDKIRPLTGGHGLIVGWGRFKPSSQ